MGRHGEGREHDGPAGPAGAVARPRIPVLLGAVKKKVRLTEIDSSIPRNSFARNAGHQSERPPLRVAPLSRPSLSVTVAILLTVHRSVYSHSMLTLSSRLDVMNRLGRAMADPTRSRILLELLEKPGYPARLSESLGLTRTNVSNHLACLRGCGLVVATPEGRQTRYEIADPHLTKAIELLLQAVVAYDDGEACQDEDCDVPLCCAPAGEAR